MAQDAEKQLDMTEDTSRLKPEEMQEHVLCDSVPKAVNQGAKYNFHIKLGALGSNLWRKTSNTT